MAIHRSQPDEAKTKLKQAKELIEQIEKNLIPHPDLSTNSTKVAYQEYAEAQIFLKLTEENRYPNPEELGIQIIPYILGLADSVGEFRRRTLDFLRKGKLKDAEICLRIMEEIYTELISLESAYSVAPELRRKCDIARHVIEATVGDVATETRRISLEKSIKHLEKKIDINKADIIKLQK
ncbi:MAG: translin [Thermoproteota archaeon]|nr:translin [Thermoproteota archaeon]